MYQISLATVAGSTKAGGDMSKNSARPTIAAFSFLLLSACATPVTHNTPSGKAEATVEASVDLIKPELINVMTNAGFSIFRDTPYQMAFDKPVDNIMLAALTGSRYDAQPDERVTYTFAPLGIETRIVADVAVVTNPGSAFERMTPMNNSQESGNLQIVLTKLQEALHPHAVPGRELRIMYLQKPGQPITISTVLVGGRGEQAGFKVGDQVTEVDGKPVADAKEFIDAANSDTNSEVDFTVKRGGETIHVKVHYGS